MPFEYRDGIPRNVPRNTRSHITIYNDRIVHVAFDVPPFYAVQSHSAEWINYAHFLPFSQTRTSGY